MPSCARVPACRSPEAAAKLLPNLPRDRRARLDLAARRAPPCSAAGLRLGWVTAHPQITEKLTMTIQVRGGSWRERVWVAGASSLGSPRRQRPPARLPVCRPRPHPPPPQSHTVGPCSLSQVVAAETLRAWGDGGLDAHLRVVQREYAERAATIAAAAAQHLAGYAEWSEPTAGMFLWLRLLTVKGGWAHAGGLVALAARSRTAHWRSPAAFDRQPAEPLPSPALRAPSIPPRLPQTPPRCGRR